VVALLTDLPRTIPAGRRPAAQAFPLLELGAPDRSAGPRNPRNPTSPRPGVGTDVRDPAPRPNRAALRRRRTVALGLLVGLCVGALIGLQATLGSIGGGPLATTGAPGALQPAASRVWIVHPGDTLWSIAKAVDPAGDVRPLVDRLAAEAGTTVLYPGEPIAIPAV
jgi:hypothetical protein